ncbi:hypothetical protein D3C79_721010 [compost metagenome]
MQAGMTRIGSLAAKGMAPSEMKHRPSTKEALPASCSALMNFLLARKVAIPIPRAGTMPAAITAAMGA